MKRETGARWTKKHGNLAELRAEAGCGYAPVMISYLERSFSLAKVGSIAKDGSN
jgi:hypothetical protein